MARYTDPAQAMLGGFNNALSTVYRMRQERRQEEQQKRQDILWKNKLAQIEKAHKIDAILHNYQPGKEEEIIQQVQKIDPTTAFTLRKTFNSWDEKEKNRQFQRFQLNRQLIAQILPKLDANTWDEGRWQYLKALQDSGLFTPEEVSKIGESIPLHYDPNYVNMLRRIYLKPQRSLRKYGPLPKGTMLNEKGEIVKAPMSPEVEQMLESSQGPKPMTQGTEYSLLQRWYDTAIKPFQDKLGMGAPLTPEEQQQYDAIQQMYQEGLADISKGQLPAVLKGQLPGAQQQVPNENVSPLESQPQVDMSQINHPLQVLQALQEGKLNAEEAKFVLQETFGITQLAQNPKTGQIAGLINGKWIDLQTGEPIQ